MLVQSHEPHPHPQDAPMHTVYTIFLQQAFGPVVALTRQTSHDGDKAFGVENQARDGCQITSGQTQSSQGRSA